MDESALAELAVDTVVGEVTKSGVSMLLGWLRGKLSGAAGQEATIKIAERPNAKSAQLALQAQLLELLETPGFAAELRARLGQAGATTTTYAAQTATGISGPVNQVQGGNSSTGNFR